MYIFFMSVCCVVIMIAMVKTHHFFRTLIISAIQGITALFAVNLIGDFIGVHIALNSFSLFVGGFGGLPGIIFLLINNIFVQ